MKRITSLLVCLLLFGFSAIFAQDIQIKGTVTTAEDGSPLPGAYVKIKGTNTGTASDFEGKYHLTVPATATLVFSSIGYKDQEIALAGQSVLDVVMASDVTQVDEVVVTALGISKEKKALGYSVQDVKGDEISKGQNTNLVNSLSGKVAGVQVVNSSGVAGSSSSIVIRGQKSITGSNQPLFIVDGVPIDNSQSASGNPDNGTNNLGEGVAYSNRAIDLNPDDIESMTVLKGGAATAVYGNRAANGAIIITTKKGKGDKMEVTFSSSVTIDKISQMPGLQKTYAKGNGGAYVPPNAAGSLSWGPKISSLSYDGATDYPWDRKGNLVPSTDPTAQSPAMAYDNIGNFFNNGVTYNNGISLSKGTEKSNFYVSLANLKSNGVVPNNTFNKTNIKVSGEMKLGDKLTMLGSASYINSGGDRIQQGSNTSGVMLGLLRTPPSFDNSNGYSDAEDVPEAYMFDNGLPRTFRGNDPNNGSGRYDNPFWTVNKNKFKDKVDRMIGYVGFKYAPTSWLTINYKLGTDFYADGRDYHIAKYSASNPAGYVVNDRFFNRDINSDLIVTFDKNISEKFHTTISVGHNMYETYSQRTFVQGNSLTVPEFYHMSNAASVTSRESKDKKRTAGIWGDFGFSYDNWIFLNITGRNDYSTTVPQQSFFYPSVSGGLVLSELDFVKSLSAITFLKVRASYAVIANDATTFSTANVYTLPAYADGWTDGVSFPFNGTPGFTYNDTRYNDKITPEKLKSSEIGFDIRLFNNRLDLDFAYYNNVSEDLLLSVPVSGANGFNSIYVNAASMTNKGIEAILGVTPVRSRDFSWDIIANFTKYENEVTKLAPGVANVFLGGFEGSDVRAIKGLPYGYIYGTAWQRDDNGNLVIDADPTSDYYGSPVLAGTEKPLAKTQADWLMGITNTFQYKGLILSFLIDIKTGGYMWNGTKGALCNFGTAQVTEDRETATKVWDGVKGNYDADGNLVPTTEVNDISMNLDQSFYGSGFGSGFIGPSEQFIEKADWVRLKEITLSYDFSRSLLKNSFLKNGAELYFTGRNLWISTPYSGVDPETSLYGANNAQGLDYFNMPGTKSYIFGLRVKF